jgi:hypothetical protein
VMARGPPPSTGEEARQTVFANGTGAPPD